MQKVSNIEDLEEFKQGLFTVQDESAGLTAILLEPKQGEKVLDCCSSPGGKTTYIAEIMQNKGEILALDIHDHRVKLVQENSKRLGTSIIQTEKNDATILNEKYLEKFDKILLDVPCLGLGVLRKKPDIKWLKTEEEIKEITKIQKQILNTCSKYLKKGGTLVYSTCSILKEENDEIIGEFLKKNREFSIEKINVPKNHPFYTYINDKYLKVYPNDNHDGFFISILKLK